MKTNKFHVFKSDESDIGIIYQPKRYQLDTSKIKTIEDVVKVLDGLGIIFSEELRQFDKLKEYAKEI
ncbi:hypothetical protein AAXE64_07620 [Priestia megaterium]